MHLSARPHLNSLNAGTAALHPLVAQALESRREALR